MKSLYAEDEHFRELLNECKRHPKGEFLVHEGYLFKDTRLYVPNYGTRELLIREVHGSSLAGSFGEKKTIGYSIARETT